MFESENPNWLKSCVMGNEPLRQTIALTVPYLQPPLSNFLPPDILCSLIRHPEPLPSLDYGLFRLLLEIRDNDARAPPLDNSAWHALTNVRHEYYNAHSKFHSTYAFLLSDHTEAQLLVEEENKLYARKLALGGLEGMELTGNDRMRELVQISEAIKANAELRAKNAEALKKGMLKLQERTQKREEMTELLGLAKANFLKTEGKRLIQFGKALYLSNTGPTETEADAVSSDAEARDAE